MAEKENKLGIENIKKLFWVIDLAEWFVESFKDKKISGNEWWKLGQIVWQAIVGLKAWEEAWAEIKDLIPAEYNELAEAFAERFDLDDEPLEEDIEAFGKDAAELGVIFHRIADRIKKLKQA